MGYLAIHRDCKRENTGDITRKLSRVILRILLDNSNNCCMRRSQFSAVVVLPDWYLPILSSNFNICDSFVS